MSYINNNDDLKNSLIPAGQVCLFSSKCIIFNKTICPNLDNLLDTDYTCICANGFFMETIYTNYTCSCKKI